MSRARVVVTGLGVVSPIGVGAPAFARALRAGESGAGPITLFDASALPTRIAAEVKGPPPALRDRKVAFALEAAEEAVAQASACGTRPGARAGAPGGACLGMGLELFSLDDLAARRRPGFAPPTSRAERLTFLQTPSDLVLHALSARHDLRAPPLALVSACAAGTDALGVAMRRVASGRWGFALAGGTDSMIHPLGVGGFCKIGATTTRNAEPRRASRPFDRDRDGFLLGEGAGVLVLEALEGALARGATPLAEVAGYGSSFDAHGISEPHPEGRGAFAAMEAALRDAGLRPDDVDVINAHGTSTPKNDPVETLAIERLLGERARRVPVVATKSMIGHLIAAAGAVEAIAAIACLRGGFVHPTLNLDHPDPACRLDHVPHVARDLAHRTTLSASYGFGGQNAAVVLRRWEGA